MKKKIFALAILSFMAILSVMPFLGQNVRKEKNEKMATEIKEKTELIVSKKPNFYCFIGFPQELLMESEKNKQETVEDTSTIIYPDLYTDFTEEEIYLIQRVVETETYTADIESKMNIVSVVFNRFNHPNKKYGKDIIDIITSPNQFAYWRTEISETTIQAVENVYKYGDTTGGCIAYRSDKHPQYWYGWELQFIDSVGHGFYKEVTEGEKDE